MDIERRLQEIEEKLEDKATKAAILNIPLETTDKEYHRQLPKNLKGLRLQCQDGTTFRYAFESGKVGTAAPSPPYGTVLANGHIEIRNLNIEELHLYVAGTAAKVVEVLVWSKP